MDKIWSRGIAPEELLLSLHLEKYPRELTPNLGVIGLAKVWRHEGHVKAY